jgi:uncharacterized protein
MPENNNHHFRGIVTGQITRSKDKKLQIQLSDGSIFKVGGNETKESPEVRQWRVVPLTDSTVGVTALKVLEKLSGQEEDGFLLVGQVGQIAKKKKTGLVEIKEGKSSLKLTISNFPEDLATNDVVNITAHLVGNKLKVVTADHLNAQNVVSVPAPRNLDAEHSLRSAPEFAEIAQAALTRETGLKNWQLSEPTVQKKCWEWVATNKTMNTRVMVNAITKEAEVAYYETIAPEPAAVQEHHDRLNVTPLGAARSIGASCFRVEIGPYEIILDAGTRPKGSQPLPEFDLIHNPNLILITHAHQDHIGALPVFHRLFGATPMICSFGTKEIAEVMLTDCLKVQELSEDFQSLFDESDLYATLFHLQTQAVGEDFSPLPGLKVRFIPAGHIVGAVCIYLEYGDRSLLYTGDYNTTSSRTTDGLRLEDLPQAEMLITESTYGSDVHPSRRSQEGELLQAIAEVVEAGGNVLIPAFALGRAQEIILALRTSSLFHTLNIPIYVDGLVRPVTSVFQDNLDLLPKAVANFAKTGRKDPFFDTTSTPPIICINSPRKRPLAIAQPSVIIASSGMMTGGASVYYGKILLERENAAVFISGYTDEESPGRLLQGLQSGTEIEADRVGLTQVIHRVAPKHLILVHGSPHALQQLSHTGDLQSRYWIHIPKVGETIAFGVPPEHISAQQLAKVDAVQEFEVEVTAEYDGMWLRVPEHVLTDPRWQRFTTTWTLQAQWSKRGTLELRTARLTNSDVEKALLEGTRCCAVCIALKGGACREVESPLYGMNVDPAGTCQEFQLRSSLVSETITMPQVSEDSVDVVLNNA